MRIITTNTSSQLTKAQDHLAVTTSENRKLIKRNEYLEERFMKLKTMMSMYSAIDKEVSKEMIEFIDESFEVKK